MATSKAAKHSKKVTKPRQRRSTKKTTAKKVKSKAKAANKFGREGSVSHFFRQQISETKKDKATILRDARKKFNGKDIPDGYYAWYHNDCKRKGLIQ